LLCGVRGGRGPRRGCREELVEALGSLGIESAVTNQAVYERRKTLREWSGSGLPPGLHPRERYPPCGRGRPAAPDLVGQRTAPSLMRVEFKCAERLRQPPGQLESLLTGQRRRVENSLCLQPRQVSILEEQGLHRRRATEPPCQTLPGFGKARAGQLQPC